MSFRQIKGNLKSINYLKHIFLHYQKASVYLFYGQEGIGKKLIAHNLAKAINCLSLEEEFEPCDRCISCKKIDSGNHPEVMYVLPEPSGSIKIEQIHMLREILYLKNYEAKKKVLIIDDAENLTLEAANSCLKIMEEPPPNCLIILISSKPKLLISTILSRCFKIGFVPLEKKELKMILKNEFNLDEPLAHYLAYFTEGRIGKAIRLSKESDILVWKNKIIDGILFYSNQFTDMDINRDKIRKISEVLLSWFRDLWLAKSVVYSTELINLDRIQQIRSEALRYSYLELEEIINFISQIFFFLDKNINPKLLWSNIKLKLLR